ncbi:ECF transporter S component [Luedemannella flava]|uniref:ECF transporter S component n=1 Tax=Luedemannella flava TaxID=349316 RepID=A0ABN2MFT1_9ACTN
MTQPTPTRWRTLDIVVASVIAVAFGVVFWGWNQLWTGVEGAFKAFPPANGAIAGVWFLPAVVGPLVIRKPGAGLFTETVAAIISALLGAQWGLTTVLYGLLQGAGGEAAFAATAYRSFRLPSALVGGALAGAAGGLLDVGLYYADWSSGWQLAHILITAASGLVIAGLGGWALTRALAQTGALDRFPSGRDRALV